jgi:YHS domain-containing protein
VQDVPEFVRKNGLSFRDYLDERHEAVLDAEHCVRLNYEAFFFGDPWSRERFLADPTDFCGLLTDPVSKQRFRPARGAESVRHEGVAYFFESEVTRARFEEAPERYRLPGWVM